MSNFGVSELRLVNPYEDACREARSAVQAQDVLALEREYPTLGDAVADCALVVTPMNQACLLEHPLRRLISRARRSMLLFGSEKFGLANEDMSHCHWLLRIPTREEHGSMNLGQAVAICLYELSAERSSVAARQIPEERLAPKAGDLERITELLDEVLSASGYVHERVAGSTRLKLRRLVRRAHWNAHDAEVWLGMLRQIRWKLLS